jgi:ABC-type uncharacterized transport system permease subunit
MIREMLSVAFFTNLLGGTIRLATPILYGALGELMTERAGILNLGVEGTMLMGSVTGFIFAARYNSLWIGFAAACITGALIGLLMAVLAATLKVNQSIGGLSINILASGLSYYLYRVSFPETETGVLPHVIPFNKVEIPFLSQIPILGEAVFNLQLITYIAFLMVPIIHTFLNHTTWGLELRALGNNPRALDAKGINVIKYQYLAVMFGGMMAGIGGAFLTIASTGMFVPGITSGRGWIALSIVIFGNWSATSILIGSLFFGFLDSFQLQIQGIGVQFPYQLLLAAPYLITILALVIRHTRSGEPAWLGKPYFRE